MKKLKYIAPILIAVACFGLQQAQATSLDLSDSMHWTTNDDYLIGTVIPTITGGGQVNRDRDMTNTLLGMASHTQQGIYGNNSNPLYSRTTWAGGNAAVSAGATAAGPFADGPPTLTITLTQTFLYLVVAYDGPNSGVAVFDVSSLQVGDQIVIARYAFPDSANHGDLLPSSSQYKITTWTLLNPTTNVPDGGATVMLLGAALGALGMARRYFKS